MDTTPPVDTRSHARERPRRRHSSRPSATPSTRPSSGPSARPSSQHPRRHRSHQRDLLLAYLRATRCHPTAAQIHEALLPRIPALALGTVYRNLDVLVAEALVVEVPTTSGAVRYDGQLEPHDHFECERCAALIDLPPSAPGALRARVARRHAVAIREVRVRFIGTCGACASGEALRDAARDPSVARSASSLPRAKAAARSAFNGPRRNN